MDTKRVFIKAKQVLLKQKAVLAILAMLILMLFFNTQFYSVYNWMLSLIHISLFGRVRKEFDRYNQIPLPVEFRFAELKKDFGIVGASELVLD